MKRNVLFGYQYQNGIITHNHKEVEIIKIIFNEYLNGNSLLQIANRLNSERIEYLPGITGWNKARLARILDDARYIGNEIYPSIIGTCEYEQVQKLKYNKNTQKTTDRCSEIFMINVPVYCPKCHSEMRRLHDQRNKCPERWKCTNHECKLIIEISDIIFLKRITELMNSVIENPDAIHTIFNESEQNFSVQRLENEIFRALDENCFNKAELRSKMLECLTLKYESIDASEHITKVLKADFEKSSLLSAFSAELFNRTVKSIMLIEDGDVILTLMNSQQIPGKEEQHDAKSICTKQNCEIYSAYNN